MKKWIILLSLGLSSCATIFNRSTSNVKIHSQEKVSIKHEGELYETDKNKPVKLLVKRGKEPLKLKVIKDSLELEVVKKPVLSNMFLGNFMMIYIAPGAILDLFTKKYLGQHSNYYVNLSDKKVRNYNFFPKKGQLNITLDLPVFNSFKLKGKHVDDSGVGIFGIGLGLEYYHSNHQYLAVNYYYHTDFLINLLTGKTYNHVISLTNNHEINRFHIGYGPNITHSYYRKYKREYYNLSLTERQTLLGLSIPLQVALGRTFRLGLAYNPTFFQVDNNMNFQYQDTWSFQLKWALPIKK